MQTAAPAVAVVSLADAEREHILGALHETGWVLGGAEGAATRLGMKRSTLYKKMKKLGISRRDQRPKPDPNLVFSSRRSRTATSSRSARHSRLSVGGRRYGAPIAKVYHSAQRVNLARYNNDFCSISEAWVQLHLKKRSPGGACAARAARTRWHQ